MKEEFSSWGIPRSEILFISTTTSGRQGPILPLTWADSLISTLRTGMRGKTLFSVTGAICVLRALPVAAADHDVSITIYANDLALVQDHRSINVTGGRQRIE